MPSKANGTPFILNVAIFFICVRTHALIERIYTFHFICNNQGKRSNLI